MAGHTVRLNCTTSDIYSVNWEHIPTGRTAKNYVYLGGTVIVPYNDRFSVEKTGRGSFTLVISSVDFRDSGLYRCIDREGQGEQREAQLAVIGTVGEFLEKIYFPNAISLQCLNRLLAMQHNNTRQVSMRRHLNTDKLTHIRRKHRRMNTRRVDRRPDYRR